MYKKFLFVTALALGLIYGSGHSLGSIKRSISSASDSTARGWTGGDNGGWGDNSGY